MDDCAGYYLGKWFGHVTWPLAAHWSRDLFDFSCGIYQQRRMAQTKRSLLFWRFTTVSASAVNEAKCCVSKAKLDNEIVQIVAVFSALFLSSIECHGCSSINWGGFEFRFGNWNNFVFWLLALIDILAGWRHNATSIFSKFTHFLKILNIILSALN